MLTQIVSMTTMPRGRLVPRTAALNQPRRTTFAQHGPLYQLTNRSHPARGESFVSLLHSALAIPHHCFSLSPKLKLKRTVDHATLSSVIKRARRAVFGPPPLSLSFSAPAFRHSDILRHNVENRRTRGSFSFSFLTPNESRRLSPCRERVVYPPLFADCRGFGGTPGRHCFFFFSLRVLPPR